MSSLSSIKSTDSGSSANFDPSETTADVSSGLSQTPDKIGNTGNQSSRVSDNSRVSSIDTTGITAISSHSRGDNGKSSNVEPSSDTGYTGSRSDNSVTESESGISGNITSKSSGQDRPSRLINTGASNESLAQSTGNSSGLVTETAGISSGLNISSGVLSGVPSFTGVISSDSLQSGQNSASHKNGQPSSSHDLDLEADSSQDSRSQVGFQPDVTHSVTGGSHGVGGNNVGNSGMTFSPPKSPTISVGGIFVNNGENSSPDDTDFLSSLTEGRQNESSIGTTRVDGRDTDGRRSVSSDIDTLNSGGDGLGGTGGSFNRSWSSTDYAVSSEDSLDSSSSVFSLTNPTVDYSGSDDSGFLSWDENGQVNDSRSGSSLNTSSVDGDGQTADSSLAAVEPGVTIASPSREAGSSGGSRTFPSKSNSGSIINPRDGFWLCLVVLFL